MDSLPRPRRRTLFQAAAVTLALTALPVRRANAQSTVSEIVAMKAAATDFLAAHGGRPTLPETRVDFARQSGSFAFVFQYPPPGTGEIARILIGKQNGEWTGLAYGGVFPPGDSRFGAPDLLFQAPQYLDRGQLGEPLWAPASRQIFQNPAFSFEYPPDAGVDLQSDRPAASAVAVVGADYRIDVQSLDVIAPPQLDVWAYDLYQSGGWPAGGPGGEPRLLAFSADFTTSNVFLVEWPYPQGVVRDFLAAPKLGGSVVLVRTAVPDRPVPLIFPPFPVPQHQATFHLLDTLRQDGTLAADGGRYVDTVAGFWIEFPASWRIDSVGTGAGISVNAADGSAEVWASAHAATSLDEALSQFPLSIDQTAPAPQPVETTINGLAARYYDFQRRLGATGAVGSRAYYIQVHPDLVLAVVLTGDIEAGEAVVATVWPVDRAR